MSDPSPPFSDIVGSVTGGTAAYLPGDTFGPRVLGDFEFVWITAGSATYTYNGRTHAAPAGTVILARPQFHEFYQWDTKQTSRHLFFHFSLAVDHAPCDWPDPATWPAVLQMPAGDAVRPLFQRVLDGWCRHHKSRADRSPPWIGRTVIAMIDAYLALAVASVPTDHDAAPPAVQRAIDWVSAILRKQPDAAISLDDMARAAKVNPSHLTRLFRSGEPAAIGMSPMRVVQLMRLEQAMTLLERSNLSVQQIAQRCGFATQFHFSRVFRKAYGSPPTDVRSRLRRGEPRPMSALPLDAPPINV